LHFTGWDKFPDPAQLAFVDMEYNLNSYYNEMVGPSTVMPPAGSSTP
jgi:hypothetical protein